jgi:hypothetical protein
VSHNKIMQKRGKIKRARMRERGGTGAMQDCPPEFDSETEKKKQQRREE